MAGAALSGPPSPRPATAPGPLSRRGFAGALLALLVALVGCGFLLPPSAPRPEPPLRLSELAEVGDPARRASMRLVLQGLDDDAALRPAAALASYERALQVDPNNPWAWLALSRHEVEHGDPAQALALLDKTEALLPPDGATSRGVEAHLVGLRGAALRVAGDGDEARARLTEARRRAPVVWADGSLDASELR